MTIQGVLAILCVELLVVPDPYMLAHPQQQPPNQQAPADGSQLTPDQLESLVAPIALYPDPILSQVLVASTYPLEIVQAARWLNQNSALQGKALVDAAAKQTWDASVQALVVFPDLLKRLNQDISWTSDLGNAFLAQEQGVMDAVQRMRQKAQSKGALQSTKEQQVSTSTQGGNTYIEIQPASPDVVYVPEYNPEAVWGPAPAYYPYPPIYYPPVYPGIVAASAISFGVGFAAGAIWGGAWGGWRGWGWGCGWGHGNVVINNNFISRNNFNRVNVGSGNSWVHNPAHRGAVPYNNRNVANRFSPGRGNVSARPTPGQVQGNLGKRPSNALPGQGNLGQRPGSGRPGQGNLGQAGNAFRPGQGQIGQGNARPGPGNVGQGAARPSGGDRVGNRAVGGGGSGNRGGGAFGGMNQGGNRARMNSNRGFASGGGARGGGFRGGGRRR